MSGHRSELLVRRHPTDLAAVQGGTKCWGFPLAGLLVEWSQLHPHSTEQGPEAHFHRSQRPSLCTPRWPISSQDRLRLLGRSFLLHCSKCCKTPARTADTSATARSGQAPSHALHPRLHLPMLTFQPDPPSTSRESRRGHQLRAPPRCSAS